MKQEYREYVKRLLDSQRNRLMRKKMHLDCKRTSRRKNRADYSINKINEELIFITDLRRELTKEGELWKEELHKIKKDLTGIEE